MSELHASAIPLNPLIPRPADLGQAATLPGGLNASEIEAEGDEWDLRIDEQIALW